MTTEQQAAPPSRRRRIGRSVEVQHGRRGLALMLRRGLHGAKNWVLEPDDEGSPSSPLTKIGRTAVILTPAWIVMSAMTGGPERGGHQIGLGQAILSALLVTLIGLGWLSARERRHGREEPWADLPSIDTSGDESEKKTLTDSAPESPTEVLENAQVSEVDGTPEVGEEVVTPGDNTDVSDQTPQISSGAVTQVVTAAPVETPSEEVSAPPFVQVGEGDRLGDHRVPEAVTQAVTSDKTEVMNHHNLDPLEDDSPTVPLVPARTAGHPAVVSFEKQTNPQVSQGDRGVTEPFGNALEAEDSSITESDIWPDAPDSSEMDTQVVTHPMQEALFPQVSTDGPVVTQVVTEAMATPGPYEVSNAPMGNDWWLTRPDVPAEEKPEEPEAEKQENSPENEPVVVTEVLAQEPSSVTSLDPAVLLYRAVRSMANAPEEERVKARRGAAEWVRREIQEGRQSQRSAAEILGVSKTAVAKMLEHDPWAEAGAE